MWRAFLAFIAFGAATILPSRAQVLVVYSATQSYADDVKAKLDATGLFPSVTLFDASSGTPVLADLNQYTALLVFSDSGFRDPAALGDVLADYIDAGGGIVEATFVTNNSLRLSGRWDTDNYDPFFPNSQSSGTALTLGTINDSSSPILSGVTNFNGGTSSYYSPLATLRSGVTLVASWSNGSPLVVVNTNFNSRIVGLNFYPPSSDARSDFWDSSTQGALLLGNALTFVAVPEPSSTALLGLGGLLLACVGLRQHKRR